MSSIASKYKSDFWVTLLSATLLLLCPDICTYMLLNTPRIGGKKTQITLIVCLLLSCNECMDISSCFLLLVLNSDQDFLNFFPMCCFLLLLHLSCWESHDNFFFFWSKMYTEKIILILNTEIDGSSQTHLSNKNTGEHNKMAAWQNQPQPPSPPAPYSFSATLPELLPSPSTTSLILCIFVFN